MTRTLEAQPDFAAIKQRQQLAWASGDFSVVAARIVLVAEHLCYAADLQPGWRVLDVATGSGNAAIAAARHGCDVVGVDYVPALLERRAAASAGRGARGRVRWRATPRRCPSRTPRSTRSRPSSARCSRPTTSGPLRSSHASAGPEAPSRSRAGRPRASSASSSAPSRPRAATGGRPLADALGHRGAPPRAVRRPHRLARRSRSARTRGGSARRRSSSSSSAAGTGRRSRRSPRSKGPHTKRSSSTSSRSRGGSTGSAAATRSRFQPPTPKRSPSLGSRRHQSRPLKPTKKKQRRRDENPWHADQVGYRDRSGAGGVSDAHRNGVGDEVDPHVGHRSHRHVRSRRDRLDHRCPPGARTETPRVHPRCDRLVDGCAPRGSRKGTTSMAQSSRRQGSAARTSGTTRRSRVEQLLWRSSPERPACRSHSLRDGAGPRPRSRTGTAVRGGSRCLSRLASPVRCRRAGRARSSSTASAAQSSPTRCAGSAWRLPPPLGRRSAQALRSARWALARQLRSGPERLIVR